MFGSPVTITPPAGELISTAEAKSFLRVDDDGFDASVNLAREAAIAQLEQITGVRLLSQSVTVSADCFDDLSLFRVGPIEDVTEVSYRDKAGVDQFVDPSDYELHGAPLEQGLRLIANRWPEAELGSIQVKLDVGYGADATDVPPQLLLAAYQLMRGQFEGRAVDVQDLVSNHRFWLP